MDIFRFTNPTAAMKMEQGELVNGLSSKMWVERYAKEGEFTLVGDADSGLREKLPLGSFISHIDSEEIMIVENHEINGSRDQETQIKVTGRSFVSIFEQRVPGANRSYPVSTGLSDLLYASDNDHDQIVEFLKDRFTAGEVTYAADEIAYITVGTLLSGGPVVPALYVKVGDDALAVAWQLLSSAGYSMNSWRPGPLAWGNGGIPDANSTILVYEGEDKSDTAVLSYDLGEIESADYFWSIKPKKTLALVTGKWVGVRVTDGSVNEEMRQVHVDATGIDDLYSVAPTGGALTDIENGMIRRGEDVLSQSKEVAITNVNVNREGTHLKYRQDYRVGDIITVQGEYNATGKFRVSEYVEGEDENGAFGYPTLAVV